MSINIIKLTIYKQKAKLITKSDIKIISFISTISIVCFSLLIGLYSSCVFQRTIYTKYGCSKQLLINTNIYNVIPDNVQIHMQSTISWYGKNNNPLSCYNNITQIVISTYDPVLLVIKFIGNTICNNQPAFYFSGEHIDKFPKLITTQIQNAFLTDITFFNVTNPVVATYTRSANNTNFEFNLLKNNNRYENLESSLNTNLFNSNLQEFYKNMDIGLTYTCNSCYLSGSKFDFQSFIRLLIYSSTIFSTLMIIFSIIMDYLFVFDEINISIPKNDEEELIDNRN